MDTDDGLTAARFWAELDTLVGSCVTEVDRQRGTRHPRFPDIVYSLDYGYLVGTTGGDGEGVDCWIGHESDGALTAVFVTVDPVKRDCEVKLCLGCSVDDLDRLVEFYRPQSQQALLVRRG